ncbi:MAG: hypothetical protein HYY37_00385 [Candidatus Aenigmarchaeota archaeon]|nr:hypothetical protein [Candidatus Aenigmarchaeota archaeon]
MPFKCKFCGNLFDIEHRLPENHTCEGLSQWKEKHLKEFHEGKSSIAYENTLEPKHEDSGYKDSMRNALRCDSKQFFKGIPEKFNKQAIRLNIHRLIQKNMNDIGIWLIGLFIIFTAFNQILKYSILESISWIFVYVAEIIFIYKLIKRVDKIEVNSDLSIWGLKILSFIFILIGVYIFLFGSLALATVYSLYVLGLLGIIALGFFSIGAFLIFKFKRRSGSIVWVGRA